MLHHRAIMHIYMSAVDAAQQEADGNNPGAHMRLFTMVRAPAVACCPTAVLLVLL